MEPLPSSFTSRCRLPEIPAVDVVDASPDDQREDAGSEDPPGEAAALTSACASGEESRPRGAALSGPGAGRCRCRGAAAIMPPSASSGTPPRRGAAGRAVGAGNGRTCSDHPSGVTQAATALGSVGDDAQHEEQRDAAPPSSSATRRVDATGSRSRRRPTNTGADETVESARKADPPAGRPRRKAGEIASPTSGPPARIAADRGEVMVPRGSGPARTSSCDRRPPRYAARAQRRGPPTCRRRSRVSRRPPRCVAADGEQMVRAP